MNFIKIFTLVCIFSYFGIKSAEHDWNKYINALDRVNFKIKKLTNNTNKKLLLEADAAGSLNGAKTLIINPGSTLTNITIKNAPADYRFTGVVVEIYDADKSDKKLGRLSAMLASRLKYQTHTLPAEYWQAQKDDIYVVFQIADVIDETWEQRADLINENVDVNISIDFSGENLENSSFDVLAVSR